MRGKIPNSDFFTCRITQSWSRRFGAIAMGLIGSSHREISE